MSGAEYSSIEEKVAALEARIEALEERLDETAGGTTDTPASLDRRDSKVVAELEHGRSYSGLQVKRLYKQHTDIRQDRTAKERAKALVKQDFFQLNGRHHVYRG